MCDAFDIGISIDSDARIPNPESRTNPESRIPNPETARIFIYDNYPGGIGFSAPLFQMHHELVAKTRQLIAECDCGNGCPGCVGPIGDTGPLAKAAALRILDLLQAQPAEMTA
jgi:DEAD/DEAH box helicase domain-containing protein